MIGLFNWINDICFGEFLGDVVFYFIEVWKILGERLKICFCGVGFVVMIFLFIVLL